MTNHPVETDIQRSKRLRTRAIRNFFQALVSHSLIIAVGLFFLVPFLWMLLTAFKSDSDVFRTPSVAALGIAAHEAGHAIQHARAYAPLKWRMAVVPVTQFASQLLPLVIIGGFMFHITGLITLGIICYGILAFFQLITLPVEFDASKRAKVILQEMGMVQPGGEAAGVNSVLNAAALTYVAAFVAALGNLVYLFLVRRIL